MSGKKCEPGCSCKRHNRPKSAKWVTKLCEWRDCDVVFEYDSTDGEHKFCGRKCFHKSHAEWAKSAKDNPDHPFNKRTRTAEQNKAHSECIKKVWQDPNSIFNSKEYRQSISDSMKEALSDESVREQMSERTRLSWKREEVRNSRIRGIETAWSNVELRQKHSEIMKSVFDTPEDRERRSRDMKSARADPDSPVNIALQAIEGNRPGQWSKSAGYHNGVWMRCLNSEGVFAQELDEAGIEWVYEPVGFRLSWCIYYPDFYLPEFDIWIEVKGWMTERAQEKIDSFRQETGKTLVVVRQDELPTSVYETKVQELVGVVV